MMANGYTAAPNDGTAHNFLSADVEKVINDEVAKAVRAQVQYDTGFFQNMANQVQLILDRPSTVATS